MRGLMGRESVGGEAPVDGSSASDATAVNGWLVRELPALFQRAGLEDIRARGFFPLETERQSFYANMADRCAEVAVKTGAITQFESRAWLDAFHEQGVRGPIVAGRLHIFVWGRKGHRRGPSRPPPSLPQRGLRRRSRRSKGG